MKNRLFLLFSLLLLISGLMLVSQPKLSAQFQGQQLWGGTSGGTANAQTILIPNLTKNTAGLVLSFLVGPGLTNTGPVTVNVTGIGATVLNRQTPTGVFALSGSELTAGMVANIMYDGTAYELLNTAAQPPIGTSHGFRGAIPPGYLIEDGSCYSTTGIYAPLFSVIGAGYNSFSGSPCAGGQFAVPFANGTIFSSSDTQGAHTAGRQTQCTGGCGAQNYTLAVSELPIHTHGITDGGHSHTDVEPTLTASNSTPNIAGSNTSATTGSSTAGMTVCYAGGTGGTCSSGSTTPGTTQPYPKLNPVLSGLRGIKF